MGADYIEPDLVSTKDHVLVARHENNLADSTNVAEHAEFAARRRTRVVDGRRVSGWFSEDFTLDELRTLRAVERLPHLRPESAAHDGEFRIPTLDEILDLRDDLSKELGREVGICPELKHSTYFSEFGLPLEPPLVAELRRHGLDRPNAPVIVQSFEVGNLSRLRVDYDLRVQLLLLIAPAGAPWDLRANGDPRTYFDLTTPRGLRGLASEIDAIGPQKDLVVSSRRSPAGRSPTTLVADAHAAGLAVYPWVFRAENVFLPAEDRVGSDDGAIGRMEDEVAPYLEAGVDGFFTDQPEIGVRARSEYLADSAAAA